jgi:hypothetical protein
MWIDTDITVILIFPCLWNIRVCQLRAADILLQIKKSFPAKHANEIKRSVTFMLDLSRGICPAELFFCYQCITHLKITKLLTLPRFNSFYFFLSSISHLIASTDLLNHTFCIDLSNNLFFGHLNQHPIIDPVGQI